MYKFLVSILSLLIVTLSTLGLLKYNAGYIADNASVQNGVVVRILSSPVFENTVVRGLTHKVAGENTLLRNITRSIQNLPTVDNTIQATVSGRSMIPTVYPGDEVTIDQDYYKKRAPAFNDLVAFKEPDTDIITVKRIRGINGDSITIHERALYSNETLIVEGEIGIKSYFALDVPHEVPLNHVFVLGDNVARSVDSRDWGFLPINEIIGVVVTK